MAGILSAPEGELLRETVTKFSYKVPHPFSTGPVIFWVLVEDFDSFIDTLYRVVKCAAYFSCSLPLSYKGKNPQSKFTELYPRIEAFEQTQSFLVFRLVNKCHDHFNLCLAELFQFK